MNQFKQGRTKPYLADEVNWDRDFNRLDRYDNVDILSLDMKRGVVELICSSISEKDFGFDVGWASQVNRMKL